VGNSDDTPPEDVSRDTGDTSDDNSHASSELIFELRERARFAERQLEETNEANRENRRIIAGLIQRAFELDSAGEPLEVSESALERLEEQGTTTVRDKAEPWQDTGVYQPRPGFLPALENKLPLRIYVLAVVVPATMTLFADNDLAPNLVVANFALIFSLFSWCLFAFFIGLKKRRFPWAACIFTGYLGSVLYVALQDVLDERFFEEPLSVLDYELGRFVGSPGDTLVEDSWFYFSLFLAGALLGKAVQRRGLNMGLYAPEEAPEDERQAARELSPRTLAILGAATPIIASVITAIATLLGN
jgi:hypothetical protein